MGWKSRGKKIYVCMNEWMSVAFSLCRKEKEKSLKLAWLGYIYRPIYFFHLVSSPTS